MGEVIAAILGAYNYWIVIALMMTGLYLAMAGRHLVRKVVGLNLFQTSVFIFYISLGARPGASAPILAPGVSDYANPLPHVLILTAIVVGVATTALALALAVRIHAAYGTLEEDQIESQDG